MGLTKFPPPSLKPSDAAEYLTARGIEISARQLRQWRAEGKGPRYTQAYRRVRYPVDGLDEFVRLHTIDPLAAICGDDDAEGEDEETGP